MIDLTKLLVATVITVVVTLATALGVWLLSGWIASRVTRQAASDPEPGDLMARFISDDEITKLFTFHPANTEDKQQAHEHIRQQCRIFAFELQDILPECPQKTVAIRQKLAEVMFYANQAIAIHGVAATEREDAEAFADPTKLAGTE